MQLQGRKLKKDNRYFSAGKVKISSKDNELFQNQKVSQIDKSPYIERPTNPDKYFKDYSKHYIYEKSKSATPSKVDGVRQRNRKKNSQINRNQHIMKLYGRSSQDLLQKTFIHRNSFQIYFFIHLFSSTST